MNLADVQKEKIGSLLIEEGIRGGATVSKAEVNDFVNDLFSDPLKIKGNPTTAVTLQQPRAQFDLPAYNNFLQGMKLDSDVLLSYLKRARIESRNLLVYNDLVMKSYMERLNTLTEEIESFNNVKETVESGGIKTSSLHYSFRQPRYVFPKVGAELNIDTAHSSAELPQVLSLSSGVSLTNSSTAVELLTDLASVFSNVEESSINNIFSSDPTPWVQNIALRGNVSTLRVRAVIELPYIEEINKLTVSPLPGVSSTITAEYASVGDNFIFVDRAEDVTQPEAFTFSPVKATRIRLTFDMSPRSVDEQYSYFTTGLTSLSLFRNIYQDEGEALFLSIDPKINDRPILSVGMKVNGSFPDNTTSKYFISINGSEPIPSTRISGDTDESMVEFSVAQKTEDPKAAVTRQLYRNRNGVDFSFLEFNNLTFNTLDTSYLPKITELWTGQNSFIERPFPDVVTRDITDAKAMFGADNKLANIIVPSEENFMPLNSDSTGSYLEVALPLQSASVYTGAMDMQTDVETLMKTGVDGVYRVSIYKSSDKENATYISPSLLSIDFTKGTTRVYITGNYAHDDSFTIAYVGKLDTSVNISSVRLHENYGRDGQEPDSTIPLSSGKYQVNYDTNSLFSTPGSGLAFTTKYVDFTGLFDYKKLRIYEAYIHVASNQASIELDRIIEVDSDVGEYISIRHLDSSTSIRLEGVSKLEGLKEGWHLISVASKPLSSHPSAIKSVLEVKDQPGVPNESPKLIFNLTETRYLTRLGVSQGPRDYVEKVNLLNDTKRYGSNEFSSVVVEGELKFIVSESGHSIIPVDRQTGGTERASIVVHYFPTNLFKDDVHSRMNLKIALENTQRTGTTLVTPSLNSIDFTIKYL